MGSTGATTATATTGSGGNITVACDSTATNHICTEFNAPAAYQESLESGCTSSSNGTLVDACPSDNLLGVCTLPEQGGISTDVYYYSYTGGPDAASLQQGCEASGGTWSS